MQCLGDLFSTIVHMICKSAHWMWAMTLTAKKNSGRDCSPRPSISTVYWCTDDHVDSVPAQFIILMYRWSPLNPYPSVDMGLYGLSGSMGSEEFSHAHATWDCIDPCTSRNNPHCAITSTIIRIYTIDLSLSLAPTCLSACLLIHLFTRRWPNSSPASSHIWSEHSTQHINYVHKNISMHSIIYFYFYYRFFPY
jgi:hypothetical protein